MVNFDFKVKLEQNLTIIGAAKKEWFVFSEDGECQLEDDPGAVSEEAIHHIGRRLVRDHADEDG